MNPDIVKLLSSNGISGLILAGLFFIYDAYSDFDKTLAENNETLKINNQLLLANQALIEQLIERGNTIDRMRERGNTIDRMRERE